jgi:hypothetical protein
MRVRLEYRKERNIESSGQNTRGGAGLDVPRRRFGTLWSAARARTERSTTSSFAKGLARTRSVWDGTDETRSARFGRSRLPSTTATISRSRISHSRRGRINGLPRSSGRGPPFARTRQRSLCEGSARNEACPASSDRGCRPLQPLSSRTRDFTVNTCKHLRVLGACLQNALRHGYAARNAVRDLPPAEKPRPERKEAACFENDEIPRLFAGLPDGLIQTLFLVALKTGMRQGELLALRWDDVDLINGVVRVRRSFTAGAVSSPKP